MKKFNQNIYPLIFFIFLGLSLFSQDKKYEIPTLDKGKIFNAKLTPDSEQEEILSAYLKGKITKDTLRIKVKGTTMVQNVTITVLSLDENEEINVEIAKGQWKKVERKGKTKKGYYRISFKTANDFGISLHNNKIGTPFNVIIWTSGELKPTDNSLFIPISEYNKKHNTSFKDSNVVSAIENTNEKTNPSNNNQKSNTMYYIIIAALIVIAILLFMLLKKKKNKTFGLFLVLFTLSNITYSQITTARHASVMEHLDKITEVANAAVSMNDAEDANRLTEEDRNSEPNVNPDGQPELPSSCTSAGNKDRPTRNKIKPRNNRRNTNRTSTDDEDTKYDDIDKPKYDEDGNVIDYGDTNSSTTQDNDPFTDDGVVVQGDGLKKDKDGNIIPGSGPTGQIMDDVAVVIHNIERPKYDKDEKVIQYDTSDRPRHDADGVPINYPIENDQTDYNREGRPKYDKDGKPIIYDDMENPRYDKNGDIIKYKETTDENLEGAPDNTNTEENGNVRDSETAYDDKGDENRENNANTGQNQVVNKTESTNNNVQNDDDNQDNSDGCKCLKKAYDNLEITRYNFEKLKIIYNRQEKITKYAISFGDDVSPLTGGLGGLAWQKERFKILKQMEKFYKAYDNKHLYYVDQLKNDLKEIEKCEAQLDFDNWYSRVGFLYFNFMKDKYKRN